MDGKLPMFIDNTLSGIISIVVTVALIAAIVPWFLLVVPVTGAAFMLVYAMFRVGVQRLQRFQLGSMAPVLTHVDATVHGLSSIHAYERVDDFRRRLTSRVLIIQEPRLRKNANIAYPLHKRFDKIVM